ncbi:MAG: hypothetical protein AAGD14_09020 [Planctomycetota bacterium]
MRAAALGLLVYGLLLAGATDTAEARPEFARRETLACGYCHIQPRGGGPRNANGIRYARHEFKFPPRKGDLNSFPEGRARKTMVRARKLVRVDHVQAARKELLRLQRSLKPGPAKTLVEAELRALDVRGEQILGSARVLLRKNNAKKRATGIELLCLLAAEYKGTDAGSKAAADLKEAKRDKALKPVIEKETTEAKARRIWLDARAFEVEGKAGKAAKAEEKLLTKYATSRAARLLAERKEAAEQTAEQTD